MAEDAQPGHNAPKGTEVLSFLQRIERLEEKKADIATDIKEVKLEASQAGHETKVINELLRQRKLQKKLGKEAYDNLKDDIEIRVDAMGQSYFAFEQIDIEEVEGETRH